MARSPVDQARVGKIEERERVGHLVAHDRQVDRPVHVLAVLVEAAVRPGESFARLRHGRADRRLEDQPAARRESTASRMASASSRFLLIRQTSVLSGSASKFLASWLERELIGAAEHDLADRAP